MEMAMERCSDLTAEALEVMKSVRILEHGVEVQSLAPVTMKANLRDVPVSVPGNLMKRHSVKRVTSRNKSIWLRTLSFVLFVCSQVKFYESLRFMEGVVDLAVFYTKMNW